MKRIAEAICIFTGGILLGAAGIVSAFHIPKVLYICEVELDGDNEIHCVGVYDSKDFAVAAGHLYLWNNNANGTISVHSYSFNDVSWFVKGRTESSNSKIIAVDGELKEVPRES